jgi:hypothetical protein
VFWLDPAVWFWVPLLAGGTIAALLWLPRSPKGVVVLAVASLVFFCLSFVATALWGWLLRDGLGPDMVESRGVTAVLHFLQGSAVPLLSLVCISALVGWLYYRRLQALGSTEG